MSAQPIRSYVARRRVWSLEELTASAVRAPSGCLIWQGGVNNKGYGYTQHDGRQWLVHRLARTLAVGEIPPGLQIDHLCMVTTCVEPTHLDVVTNEENQRRREAAFWANDPRCINGHAYTPDNIRRDRHGYLLCKTCDTERGRAWRAKKRASAA